MIHEHELINEISQEYGSVSKMIAGINNEVNYLREHGGHKGRDGADTLNSALRNIPLKFHSIYYKYAHSTYKP